MNQTSIPTFSSTYCYTPWPAHSLLTHCLSYVALCIWDLLWVFAVIWKETWHPVLPSGPMNEHFISESALVFISLFRKRAWSKPPWNPHHLNKDRWASELPWELQRLLELQRLPQAFISMLFPGSWCSLHLCFQAGCQCPWFNIAQRRVTGGCNVC